MACGTVRAEPVLLDGVAAVVNKDFITVSDVMALTAPIYAQLRESHRGPDLETRLTNAYAQALDSIIERRLVVDAYQRQDSKIPDKAIQDRIDEILKEQSKGDRPGFLAALQKEGMTLDEWRGDIRNRLIFSHMRSRMAERQGIVSPADVREAYAQRADRYAQPEKIRLRMIVIGAVTGGADADARRKIAEDVRRRAAAGEDFAALAREFSTDRRASQGGDWGWILPDILRREISQAARGLKPGAVSDLVEVGGDGYILKVEDRREGRTPSLDAALPDIEKDLRTRDSARLYDTWVQRLKQQAYIRVFSADLTE
jgi:peptidyl-prolyl cis-trans isomerase SurA